MSEIDLQDALERLKLEFIDNSAEKLDKIDEIIDRMYRGVADDRGSDFVEFQRDVHSLKGSAGTYGFQSVSLIAHRLEDYIETTRRLTGENFLAVQVFIDRIREILESGNEVAHDGLAPILESLPTSATSSEVTEEASQNTVLLVMPKGVQRKLVTSDLTAAGLEIAYADHPLEAFNLAVSLRPDLLVTSVEFDNLSGLELSRALRGVNATAEMPIILLTSHAVDQMSERLPKNVYAIHKDANFASKLGDTLGELGFSRATS